MKVLLPITVITNNYNYVWTGNIFMENIATTHRVVSQNKQLFKELFVSFESKRCAPLKCVSIFGPPYSILSTLKIQEKTLI